MIKVKKIYKKFQIGHNKERTILEFLINLLLGKKPTGEFYALKDISLEVRKGERVGIVGLNGSGKSTLLSIIAGIYKPNSGTVESSEDIKYLSGFSRGLRSKLTIKENVLLVGSIMGLGQKDIKKLLDKIVKEADLTDYQNTKIEHLSSGMKTRLTFSIGFTCLKYTKPKILLLDEIFGGGGDIRFTKKASEKMGEFISNKTVIIVSHNLGQLRKYCTRIIWLHKGEIIRQGDVEEILDEYEKKYSSK